MKSWVKRSGLKTKLLSSAKVPVIGVLLVAVLAGGGGYAVNYFGHAHAAGAFSDNFSTYPTGSCMPDGTNFGSWTVAYAGYGCTKVISSGGSWLSEEPKASTSPSETHASMTLGPSFSGAYNFSADVLPVKQLRTGSSPNPWETGWVVWDYTDDSHFYYFVPKPNGWELGKEDPAYPGAQRFLVTKSSPAYPIGSLVHVVVSQDGSGGITVSANGVQLATFTDTERPYSGGRIGLYNEDCQVQFSNVSVTLVAASPAPTPSPTAIQSSDTVPPQAQIHAPSSGSHVSGNVTISAGATDNVGVVSLEVDIDGAVFATAQAASLSTSWNTNGRKVSAGSHTITVKARDAAGNTGTASATVYK